MGEGFPITLRTCNEISSSSLNSSFLSQKVSHFLPPDPLPVRPRLLNKHKERTNQSCLYSLRSGEKKSDLRTRRELSEPHIKKRVSSLCFKTWLGTGCAEPSPQAAERERSPPPPACSRAGEHVDRATQRTLSEPLSLYQGCLVPGICNFPHALCVPVSKWVPTHLFQPGVSLGIKQEFPETTSHRGGERDNERTLPAAKGKHKQPHIPHSTKADKINSQSRALSLSYQTSGVWIL